MTTLAARVYGAVRWRAAVAVLVVGVVAYVVPVMTLAYFKVPGAASALWWPAAGLALVIVVRSPRRWWPAMFVALAVGTAWANHELGGWAVMVGYALVNVLEVVVAAVLLVDHHRIHDRRLRTGREVIRFAIAIGGAVAVGAVLIAVRTVIFPTDAARGWVIGGYVVTHVLGLLTFAPLLLSGRTRWLQWRQQSVEFAVLVGVTVIATGCVMAYARDPIAVMPLLLPVVWAAIRFGPVRTTVVSVLVIVGVTVGAAHGRIGFAAQSDGREQVLVAAVIATVALTALLLIITTRHRARLADQARDSERTLRLAFRDALVGMYTIRLDDGHLGEIGEVNEALCRLLGYGRSQLAGHYCGVLGARGNPEEARILDDLLATLARREKTSFHQEAVFLTSADEELWVDLSMTIVGHHTDMPAVLVQIHDLTGREQSKRALERLAHHDSLTGLANRTLLFERLGALIHDAAADHREAGLMYLDLDGFKPVNDTYGHAGGDTVLTEVAARVTATVRGEDTVARIGGDEFAVVCPRLATGAQLTVLADRLRAVICAPIELPCGNIVSVDVSIGSAVIDGTQAPDDVIRAADSSMYGVKRRRRGRIEA